VYDPGGKACRIDDSVVADAGLWGATGIALRRTPEERARQAGAVVSIAVSDAHDEPGRSAPPGVEAHPALEWCVHAVPENEVDGGSNTVTGRP